MKPTRNPKLADWRDQVLRRNLRICEWLGLDPGQLIRIDDSDPDDGGQVEITWEATAPQTPTHGKILTRGTRGGWNEPTIHSGTLLLHALDSRELLEVAGPRPEFPLSAEDRAALHRMAAQVREDRQR